MPDFKIRTASSGWVSPVNITSNAALDYYVEQQAKLQASDASNIDWLGFSVSLSSDGNTAIVGGRGENTSPNSNNGAAYIFTRSGSTWTEEAKLLASDAASDDEFGFSVALSGDGNTAIVGSVNEDSSSNSNNGAVYIFTRSESTWTEQQKLLASDAATDDVFGGSVSLSSDGNTAIVGSYTESASPTSGQGAAYVFTRSGSTWTQQQKLLASDAASSDGFGWSVYISADSNTAIIGALFEDTGATINQGAAYIFTRSGSTWTQQAKLLASDAATGETFGSSVSLSSNGSTALIGAYQEDTGANTDNGAAYVFTRSGTTWSQQAKLLASDAASTDYFGFSVALSANGNTALIGAYLEDTSAADQGAAYVFTRSGTTWTQQQKLTESIPFTNDWYGWSVAISSDGNTLLIGAQGDDGTGGGSQGAAFVFNSVPRSTPRQVRNISVKNGATWGVVWAPPPGAPVLTASNFNAYTNSLTWTAPTSVSTITNYTLQSSPNNSTWTTIYTGLTRSFTHTNLTQNTTHYYRVSASTSFTSGPYSTTVSQTTRVATLKRSTFTSAGTWTKPTGVTTVDVLTVAGGRGGSTSSYRYIGDNAEFDFVAPGGSGCGQVLYSASLSVTSASSFSVGVGSGGLGSPFSTNGGNSNFGTLTTAVGGSGGQGAAVVKNFEVGYDAVVGPAGAGTNGMGNGANANLYARTYPQSGAGGGRLNASSNTFSGLDGTFSDISGVNTMYGRGGSGVLMYLESYYYKEITGNATAPAANTGDGGHAGLPSVAEGYNSTANGTNGGSGIVIVRWYD
jgi:hypothetical protein